MTVLSSVLILQGLTPLHLCIIGNHIDCIRKLLEINVNINSRTHNGSLPVHFAAYLGNMEIFDLLCNQSKPSDLIETDQYGNVCHLNNTIHLDSFFSLFSRLYFISLLHRKQPTQTLFLNY